MTPDKTIHDPVPPAEDSVLPESIIRRFENLDDTIDRLAKEVTRLREIERCARGVQRTAHSNRDVVESAVVPTWWDALIAALAVPPVERPLLPPTPPSS